MPAETYDPDGLATVTVQIYNHQLGLLVAEKGRSRFIRDAFGLLEDGSLDPYTRAGEPPGVALRRALDDAKRAGKLTDIIRSLLLAINTIYERNPELEMYIGVSMAMSYAEEALGEPAAPGGGERR